jgi:hypothetical protein
MLVITHKLENEASIEYMFVKQKPPETIPARGEHAKSNEKTILNEILRDAE